MATIEAISAVFGTDRHADRFCTTMPGQHNLVQLGARLAGSRDLVGLYVPEGAEPDYNSDSAQYGRVVALVRMLPMPAGSSTQHFPSGCMELKGNQLVDRWPFGWPSEIVFFSPHGGPVLRDAVARAFPGPQGANYGAFAGQFLQGPIDLRRMPALRGHLMTEVLHEIARDPAAQVRAF